MLQGIKPHRVLTDGDLDGITAAGILLRAFPNLIVEFGHPGGIRAGVFDNLIDSHTIICDLPSHPACGAVIDHHETNRADVEDVLNLWQATPSAARIAFEIVGESQDVSDLQDMIDWVDILDGGKISRDDFLSNHPMVVLSRSIEASERPEAAKRIVKGIAEGWGIEQIITDPLVAESINRRAPSAICKTLSTSAAKSLCPGVSMILILEFFQFIDVGLARIVIPLSFSNSPESITLSSTFSFSLKVPLCFIRLSIKVVFP